MKYPKTAPIILLILANLIPLYGVLFKGWQVFTVMFLYWLENVIVGFFNVLKMRSVLHLSRVKNKNKNRPTNLGNDSLILFFIFHFGLFTFVHGVFVMVFFWPPTMPFLESVFVLGSLFLSHGFSYYLNFLGNREYLNTSIDAQMIAPYGRILVMHFAILFGGIMVKSSGWGPAAIIVLVGVKIVIDILSHTREHRLFSNV